MIDYALTHFSIRNCKPVALDSQITPRQPFHSHAPQQTLLVAFALAFLFPFSRRPFLGYVCRHD